MVIDRIANNFKVRCLLGDWINADSISCLVKKNPVQNSNFVETEQYGSFIARDATSHAFTNGKIVENSKRDEKLRRFIKKGSGTSYF